MHYEIQYDPKDPCRDEKAIDDVKNYLGEAKFIELTGLLQKDKLSLKEFRLIVSFTGVQGFPAEAWWKYCNDTM